MEKTRKLRLKRKLPQQKVLVTSEHSREQNSAADVVTLLSESEDCSGGQQCKQRKVTEDFQSGVKSIGFLQTNNPSLNRLREMILSLSPKDVELDNLPPFPALHTQIEPDSKESKTAMFQERLQTHNKVQSFEDLPPFPKICRHFRRQPFESQTDKFISNPCSESSDSNILKRKPDINNGCTELRTAKESIQTDCKQSIRNSTLKDSNHQSSKIQTSFTNVVGDDNSGSIRDRNSNLYALQTRNRHVRPEERDPETSMSETHTNQRDRHIVRTGDKNPQSSILNKQTETERPVMKKGIDKSSKLGNLVVNNQSSKSKDVSASSESQNKEEIKNGGTLQNCPLCQMEFDSRCGQMEIDSHIATCLSAAEDDVVW